MKNKPKKVLFVLLSDMVHSKEVADREAFGDKLGACLKSLSKRHKGAFYAPPVQSKGIDELSAIIRDPAAIPDVVFELAIDLYPHVLRFAIATGEISPLSKVATKADGEAFHQAARSLQLAEKKRRLFQMESLPAREVEMAQLLLHHGLSRIASWPPATALAAHEKWYHPEMKHEELARKLGVTPQAISKKLRRSCLDELTEARRLLKAWFSSFPSSLQT